jgi:type II secretory pathway pseudopilin PulG
MSKEFMRHTKGHAVGFSLVELLIVIAVVMIGLAVAVLNIRTGLASSRLNSGVQTTLSQLRLAREAAVARRMAYRVTFTPPGTILTERLVQGQPPVRDHSEHVPRSRHLIDAARRGAVGDPATADPGVGILGGGDNRDRL